MNAGHDSTKWSRKLTQQKDKKKNRQRNPKKMSPMITEGHRKVQKFKGEGAIIQ